MIAVFNQVHYILGGTRHLICTCIPTPCLRLRGKTKTGCLTILCRFLRPKSDLSWYKTQVFWIFTFNLDTFGREHIVILIQLNETINHLFSGFMDQNSLSVPILIAQGPFKIQSFSTAQLQQNSISQTTSWKQPIRSKYNEKSQIKLLLPFYLPEFQFCGSFLKWRKFESYFNVCPEFSR